MSSECPSAAGEFETVHTVLDYYDGPRSGIADYHGRPHAYAAAFPDAPSGAQDYFEFLLQPVDKETFDLAMEDWAIWCRWERAFHSGRTRQETHPALPEDRPRHQELEELLSARLQVAPDRALRARGLFTVRKPAEPGLTSSAELVVQWFPHEENG